MSGTKRRPRKVDPIPEFKSREEEAEFWDTHDFTDNWDQWKLVKVSFKLEPWESISVSLDAHNMKLLRARAKQEGMAVESLVQVWILERLQGQEPEPGT